MSGGRLKLRQQREVISPVPPVRREVLAASPAVADPDRPPLLLVPGFGCGAWVYAEHWLDYAAERGFRAYAMSLRGQGESGSAPRTTLRAYAHDVVQVAASLPRQAVLVGHGSGALVVARALARYPARAVVLAAPVLGGLPTLGRALLRNPLGTVPALFGGRLRLRRRQLFSRGLPAAAAAGYARRVGRTRAPLAQWQLLLHREPEPPVGSPPVLVLGSPDDAVVSPSALAQAARRYGSAPLLFPGMGHAMMLDARWREPIDAVLDWLEKPG
ncbi:MAG: alpha/beta fold hydrolase [Micromonosporaceae bacterium]|nr:alpha/beta fold hydrolase [Micromonosporaceae bacterium]